MQKKLRVVVDTNIFISGLIIPSGYPYRFIKLWKINTFQIITSEKQISEIKQVLERKKLKRYHVNEKTILIITTLLEKYCFTIPLQQSPIKVRDPKDQFILEMALSSRADYLISGDKDLLSLKGNHKLGKTKIMTVGEFINKHNHT